MVMSRVISTTANPMPMMEALVMWTPEAVSVKLPASEVESPSFRVLFIQMFYFLSDVES